MTVLGVTGGIGSGKSTVSHILQRDYKAEIVDTDQIGRKIFHIGAPVYEQVIAAFGREYLAPDGAIDRKKLAGLVFSDDRALAKLNSITHPEIRRIAEERIAEASGLVVIDGALLIEAGFHNMVDRLLLVTAQLDVRLKRIIARDGCTEAQAMKRIASQLPDQAKKPYADLVIDNSFSLDALEKRLREVMKSLEEK